MINATIPKTLISDDMSPYNKQLVTFLILKGFKKGAGPIYINGRRATQYETEIGSYKWNVYGGPMNHDWK